MKFLIRPIVIFVIASLLAMSVLAQSRNNTKGISFDGTVVTVTASREDKKSDAIKLENLFLYENGIEQKIKNFTYDPSPAKIVLLVDNSLSLPTTVESMKKAVMEFAYEIFEGDQIFVVAYDEKAEIIQEWTDDAKKLEASVGTFRKKGNPYLFDALNETVGQILVPLMPGTRKTVVVLISDGLDRGSKTSFDLALNRLQLENVTLYALQMPDRTGGAYRRDQPKAPVVLSQLAEGTGGKVFPLDDVPAAAKFICDELRKNRYLLSYVPTNASTFDARRFFLIADDGINIRSKTAQPPNVK